MRNILFHNIGGVFAERRVIMRKAEYDYINARLRIKEKWNRVLPYGDYIVDRWEKARFLGFGEGTSIYDSAMVLGNVRVGNDVWIGPNVMLDGSGGELAIGNCCSISTGVQIYTHDTVLNCVSGGKNPKVVGNVHIGDNCYIAPSSIVSKGVSLGNGCVVCAKSFVNKKFGDYAIIAGIPAKQIGYVKINDDGMADLVYYTNTKENVCTVMWGGG